MMEDIITQLCHAENASLRIENAELRDLCGDLATRLMYAQCVHCDDLMPNELYERLRKLGIKTDGR